MKTISKTFHSNCLLQAIKAKLKDWQNIELIKLGKDIMLNSTHYMWANKTENKIYHFSYAGDRKPLTSLWFKGQIRQQDLTSFKLFLYNHASSAGNNLEAKLLLKYDLMEISHLVGARYIEDKEYPTPQEAQLVKAWHTTVQVNRFTANQLVIQFIDISKDPIPEDTVTWQYLTKFNPNYDMFLKSQGQL